MGDKQIKLQKRHRPCDTIIRRGTETVTGIETREIHDHVVHHRPGHRHLPRPLRQGARERRHNHRQRGVPAVVAGSDIVVHTVLHRHRYRPRHPGIIIAVVVDMVVDRGTVVPVIAGPIMDPLAVIYHQRLRCVAADLDARKGTEGVPRRTFPVAAVNSRR